MKVIKKFLMICNNIAKKEQRLLKNHFTQTSSKLNLSNQGQNNLQIYTSLKVIFALVNW